MDKYCNGEQELFEIRFNQDLQKISGSRSMCMDKVYNSQGP